MTDKEIVAKALDILVEFGGIDGAHHKAWVIDQAIRVLAGDGYEALVEECGGMDEGIAP